MSDSRSADPRTVPAGQARVGSTAAGSSAVDGADAGGADPATASWPLVHRLRVRWAEADMQGVVFNANYLAWFDIGITEYLRGVAGGDRDRLAAIFDKLYVVRSILDYRAPARFDDEIEVCARTARLGNSSLEVAFAIRRDGEVLVEGRNVYVHTSDGRPAPLPDDLRQRVAAYEAGVR